MPNKNKHNPHKKSVFYSRLSFLFVAIISIGICLVIALPALIKKGPSSEALEEYSHEAGSEDAAGAIDNLPDGSSEAAKENLHRELLLNEFKELKSSKKKLMLSKDEIPNLLSKSSGYMRPESQLYGRIGYEEIEEWIDKGLEVDGEYITLDAFANKLDKRFDIAFDKTVGLSLDLEYPIIKNKGGKNYLQLVIQSVDKKSQHSTPLNICFLIDRSGSMESEGKLESVKKTIVQLLDKFDTKDKISIIAFDDRAEVVLSGKSISDKAEIIQKLNDIMIGGGTDINTGIVYAVEEVQKYATSLNSSVVFLMSDGNHQGSASVNSIIAEVQNANSSGIQMNSLGFGLDYDEVLLNNIATAGNGKYHFVANSQNIYKDLEGDFLLAKNVIAKSIRLQIILNEQIGLKKVFGFEWLTEEEAIEAKSIEKEEDEKLFSDLSIPQDRMEVDDKGINILIPNLIRNQYFLVMIEIESPEYGNGFDGQVAEVNLKYKDLLKNTNGYISKLICQNYTDSQKIVQKSENFAVRKSRYSLMTSQALMKASQHIKKDNIHEAEKDIKSQIDLLDSFYKKYSYSDIRDEMSLLKKYQAVVASLDNPTEDNTTKRIYVGKTLGEMAAPAPQTTRFVSFFNGN